MRDLKIYAVTWNVKTLPPEEDLNPLFHWDDDIPDVIIVGMQEVNCQPHNMLMDALFDDPWNRVYMSLLQPQGYIRVHKERLQGIMIIMFALEKHLVHFRNIYSNYTRMGLNGLWGNKGVVSIRTELYGCSFCFVTSHLAPFDDRLEERIEQYETAIKSHTYNDCLETTNILYHDYVLWIGDLNFRIEENTYTAEEIDELVATKKYNQLLAKDQLNMARKEKKAFSELEEGQITFAPTYKYIEGSHDYTLKRRPAWTDRILWRVNPDVYSGVTLSAQQLDYKALHHFLQSDHKPVSSRFHFKVFPGDLSLVDGDNGLLSQAVTFVDNGPWRADTDCKCSYILPDSMLPSSYDWIGLYKEEISCVRGYVYYQWAATEADEDDTYSVTFPDTVIMSCGYYRCIFFTNNGKDIVGLSHRIQVMEYDSSDESESSDEEFVDTLSREAPASAQDPSSENSSVDFLDDVDTAIEAQEVSATPKQDELPSSS